MAEDFDVDLVASFDLRGECVSVDLADPKWNYLERVDRLQKRHGFTKSMAEEIVRTVIAEKEHDPGVSVTFLTRCGKRDDGVSFLCEDDF